MQELAADYVKNTITRLPNLIATRETTRFEDTPSVQMPIASAPMMVGGGRMARAMSAPEPLVSSTEYKSLHSIGSSSITVTYRDGREVQDEDAQPGKNQNKPTKALTTVGEFGPILEVVTGDALHGEVTWQRWEQGTSEPVAVFRYAVPEEQSNYLVELSPEGKSNEVYPGYHGEIAIDPSTGAILRISLMAELPPPHQAMQTAILVEYAPVMIGEQSYICPVRSVAFLKIPLANAPAAQDGAAVKVETQLNDVAFTHYHLFRSKARIVTDASGKGDATPGAPPAAPSTAAAPATGAPPPGRQP
jgi:hypothetical protein